MRIPVTIEATVNTIATHKSRSPGLLFLGYQNRGITPKTTPNASPRSIPQMQLNSSLWPTPSANHPGNSRSRLPDTTLAVPYSSPNAIATASPRASTLDGHLARIAASALVFIRDTEKPISRPCSEAHQRYRLKASRKTP